MKPIVFNDTIGWLSEGGGSRGVVIAGAFGFEDLCSRRFLTLLADRIAAAGVPVLRFDYPGCGDAAGEYRAPGQVAAWRGGIEAAIDCLKRKAGVADVLLIGFRLGALLAPAVAVRRSDVAGLALLAPPVSGKAHVRELTGLSRMIDAALPAHTSRDAVPFDGLEVAGFRLSRETLEDLRALDWSGPLEGAGVADVLMMPNVETPTVAALAERLSAAGRAVTTAPFAGYNKLMCDPTANEIPQDVLDRCAVWISAHAGDPLRRLLAAPPDEGEAMLTGPDYVEKPVLIGPAPAMAGVFCRPRGRAGSSEALVFLNAGAVPHVGWARGTVEAARALAAQGVASLRIDLPGLGESEQPAEERVFLYDHRTRDDVIRAIDWLEQAGYPQVGLAGICAGAFQAFHAARADSRVRRLTMINPLCFAWNSSYALEMAVWKTYGASKVMLGYDKAAPQDDAGGRLARFGAAVSLVPRRLTRRGLEAIKTTLSQLSPAVLLSGRPVERWMRDLTRRGVEVMMVTSEGDLSLEEIDRHFGPDAVRLKTMKGVRLRSIPAADHTLTPSHARRALIACLAELYDSGSAGHELSKAMSPARGKRCQALLPVDPAE